MSTASDQLCRCGHRREVHEHYRRGTDCALCGVEVCPKFRPQLGRLRGALHAAAAALHTRNGTEDDRP